MEKSQQRGVLLALHWVGYCRLPVEVANVASVINIVRRLNEKALVPLVVHPVRVELAAATARIALVIADIGPVLRP